MIDFDDYPDYVEFTADDERALADMEREIRTEARKAQLRQQREKLEGGPGMNPNYIVKAWPRISVTSKLDGIRSWSLQALDTCPGSIESPGVLVDACKGCYATTGNYVFANVKAPREYNRTDWQRLDWCDNMVSELARDHYFRWLDSGDLYTLALAEKVLEVMQRTPWVKHWLPTRMYKFPKFRQVLDQMQALPNVSVRFSADSVTGEYIEGLHGSVIGPSAETFQARTGVSLCQAYEHEGRCNGCRACWDKSIDLIAYPAHGRKMVKVIMMKVER